MPGRPSPSIQRTQGGVTVGVNLGIAEVGVTTDYGGGGKIGFGGQSVTWGLEGGRIQLGIAGFEVIVEARNCVVTEVKKIAGQVVSTRTYPDPGCKEEKPKEEKPQQPKIPQDLSPVIPTGLDENVFGYVLCNYLRKFKIEIMFTGGSFNGSRTDVLNPIEWESRTDIKIIGSIPDPVPAIFSGFWPPFTVESVDEIKSTYTETYRSYGGVTVQLGDWIINPLPATFVFKRRARYSEYSFFAFFPFPNRGGLRMVILNSTVQTLELSSSVGSGEWPPNSGSIVTYSTNPTIVSSFCLFGELPVIRDYIIKENTKISTTNVGNGYDYRQILVAEIVKVGKQTKIIPPTGNRPPMNSQCCKEILADLADLKEVFAVKEMLKGECTFPWRLRMPGGQGEEKITDYANYLRALAQEIDHLGIHPPKLYIQDNNNAQAGNQTVDIKFPSATSAFEALMRQVWDDNADGDTRTNFLYRLAWLSVQNQEMCLRTIAIVKAIAHGLGIETEVDTDKIPIPFNITAGIKKNATRGQGFGKGSNPKPQIDNRIDLNTEIATEALLPEFLQCRENEVLIETFSGDKDIMAILSLILMHVEKLNSK